MFLFLYGSNAIIFKKNLDCKDTTFIDWFIQKVLTLQKFFFKVSLEITTTPVNITDHTGSLASTPVKVSDKALSLASTPVMSLPLVFSFIFFLSVCLVSLISINALIR